MTNRPDLLERWAMERVEELHREAQARRTRHALAVRGARRSPRRVLASALRAVASRLDPIPGEPRDAAGLSAGVR